MLIRGLFIIVKKKKKHVSSTKKIVIYYSATIQGYAKSPLKFIFCYIIYYLLIIENVQDIVMKKKVTK
jgi:hypothetical protein